MDQLWYAHQDFFVMPLDGSWVLLINHEEEAYFLEDAGTAKAQMRAEYAHWMALCADGPESVQAAARGFEDRVAGAASQQVAEWMASLHLPVWAPDLRDASAAVMKQVVDAAADGFEFHEGLRAAAAEYGWRAARGGRADSREGVRALMGTHMDELFGLFVVETDGDLGDEALFVRSELMLRWLRGALTDGPARDAYLTELNRHARRIRTDGDRR